jgi:hypothetical protein
MEVLFKNNSSNSPYLAHYQNIYVCITTNKVVDVLIVFCLSLKQIALIRFVAELSQLDVSSARFTLKATFVSGSTTDSV